MSRAMSAKPLLNFGSRSSESIHGGGGASSSSSSSSRRSQSAYQLPPMQMRDWRNALRSQPTYKIGNRTFTFRLPTHVVLVMAVLLLLILFFYLINPTSKFSGGNSTRDFPPPPFINLPSAGEKYNQTYPLTPPLMRLGQPHYRIAIIADMDTNSKSRSSGSTWVSYLKMGFLSHNRASDDVEVIWDGTAPVELSSHFSLKGRGMELSELRVFNGKLYTFDDRTGIVYQIVDNQKLIPWVLLVDGDGQSMKGFKAEWATVKDKTLYVGSMGKEWTTSAGDFESHDPMFVKAIRATGEVHHLNWIDNFKAIRGAIDINWPGYMIHESGEWSEVRQKWYFLPRRCSKERYNETRDETMGCNVLIECDEQFHKVHVIRVGDLTHPTRGFSSFKFLPGTEDRLIVALKSEEFNGKTSTYYTVFSVDGKIIVPDTKIDTDLKYEGIEFV